MKWEKYMEGKMEVAARGRGLLENCLELQRGQVNKNKKRLWNYIDKTLYEDNKKKSNDTRPSKNKEN